MTKKNDRRFAMRRLGVATLITICLALIGTAHAETPFGSLRVFVATADPTSDFSGDIGLGSPVSVEGDSSTGFGFVYEIRINQRVGLETGMTIMSFDFGLEFQGASGELGDATAIPVMFGLDVHLLGENTKADLYVGPVLGYTVWGDLELSPTAGGGIADLDDGFGMGAVLGLDVPFGSSKWQFNAALRYLQMSAEDPSAEIEVDPVFFEVGLGYRF
jgi:outer membrane protein W